MSRGAAPRARRPLLFSLAPYLLLVTFYTPALSGLDPTALRALASSPFDGVAVPLVQAYDTSPVRAEDLAPAVAALREARPGIAVWPWVFLNRIVGYDPAGRPLFRNGASEPFRSIAGMDLRDEQGALSAFLDTWRTALALARDLGAPGIVVDPETYNNYEAYKLAFVAAAQGMSEGEAAFRLRLLGQRMVEIADETYPGAVLWFLFTGVSQDVSVEKFASRNTNINIVLGMLSTARLTGSRVTIVSGGEGSIGYCNASVGALRAKMLMREEATAGLRAAYPALRLGGTIAPWADAAKRTGWMLGTPACRDSDARSAEDFIPYFAAMGKGYEYVWIYAASAAAYNPYDAEAAQPIHDALRTALRPPER